MDRGAWWATVHKVAKSWMGLKGLRTHAHTYICVFLLLVNEGSWTRGYIAHSYKMTIHSQFNILPRFVKKIKLKIDKSYILIIYIGNCNKIMI